MGKICVICNLNRHRSTLNVSKYGVWVQNLFNHYSHMGKSIKVFKEVRRKILSELQG